MANDGANIATGGLSAETVAILKRNWPLPLLAGVIVGLIDPGVRYRNANALQGYLA
jgi:hypothetical protein